MTEIRVTEVQVKATEVHFKVRGIKVEVRLE